jgi:hypothetical protein
MDEMAGHCSDHEKNMERGISNETCIGAMKRERQHQFSEMRTEAQQLWNEVKSKLSAGTFWKVVGLLIILIGSMNAYTLSTLSRIESKVTIMAELQAKEIGKDEVQHKGVR